MNDSMAIATSAMRTAENRVSAAAQQIVRAVSAGQTAGVAVPTADLMEGMTDLKQSELAFREGITVFKAADDMTRHALDILT